MYCHCLIVASKSVARAFLVDITDDVASAAARGSLLLPSSGPGDGRMQTGIETLSTLDVVGEERRKGD